MFTRTWYRKVQMETQIPVNIGRRWCSVSGGIVYYKLLQSNKVLKYISQMDWLKSAADEKSTYWQIIANVSSSIRTTPGVTSFWRPVKNWCRLAKIFYCTRCTNLTLHFPIANYFDLYIILLMERTSENVQNPLNQFITDKA